MNIFKKKYTLRKFSEQRTAKGFAVKASYTDQVEIGRAHRVCQYRRPRP